MRSNTLIYSLCSVSLLLAFSPSCKKEDTNNGDSNSSSSDESKSDDKTGSESGSDNTTSGATGSDVDTGNTDNSDSKSDKGSSDGTSDSGSNNTTQDSGGDSSSNDTGEDSDSTSTDTVDPAQCQLGDWDGKDKRTPSQSPPCGFKPDEVPMFVVIGWDDNGIASGMQWAVDIAKSRKNKDGSPVHFSFYNTTAYVGEAGSSWKDAMDAGHEMGNHTKTHNISGGENVDGGKLSQSDWETEIVSCEEGQAGVGIDKENLYGMRAPRLEENDAMIKTVYERGYWYDCSIEEGVEEGHVVGIMCPMSSIDVAALVLGIMEIGAVPMVINLTDKFQRVEPEEIGVFGFVMHERTQKLFRAKTPPKDISARSVTIQA